MIWCLFCFAVQHRKGPFLNQQLGQYLNRQYLPVEERDAWRIGAWMRGTMPIYQIRICLWSIYVLVLYQCSQLVRFSQANYSENYLDGLLLKYLSLVFRKLRFSRLWSSEVKQRFLERMGVG
eukprot:TRINITY_DN1492_c0_g1_i10.p3 TRINITY_DN1492_c0_g1~~TRINITY_DN1492_c0_g1_i10.p3  ORF type:complete len:122 (-),score=7.56 TRINITY_DN1492_c0_g1_i10:1219-1584(-)